MDGPLSYYFDEHVPLAIATGLRLRRIDVVTTQEAGMNGAPDDEQLEYAARSRRIVFTKDADFLRLHAAGESHCGIVFTNRELSVGETIQALFLIAHAMTADEMMNHIEYL